MLGLYLQRTGHVTLYVTTGEAEMWREVFLLHFCSISLHWYIWKTTFWWCENLLAIFVFVVFFLEIFTFCTMLGVMETQQNSPGFSSVLLLSLWLSLFQTFIQPTVIRAVRRVSTPTAAAASSFHGLAKSFSAAVAHPDKHNDAAKKQNQLNYVIINTHTHIYKYLFIFSFFR